LNFSLEGKMTERENALPVEDEEVQKDRKPVSAADLRYAAYFILVIAAIFVINAMESGSYRTPWPVAFMVSVIGLAILAYSFVKAAREDRQGS